MTIDTEFFRSVGRTSLDIPAVLPHRRGLSLGVQFFLAAAALLATTLTVAIALSSHRAQMVAEQTIRESLQTIPQLWSGYVNARAEAATRQMRSLASESGMKALLGDASRDPATLHDTAKEFSKGLGAAVMFLFDERGGLLERTDRDAGEERGRDFSAVSWVATPLEERSESSAFILDATRARMVHMVASAPVMQGAGTERRLNGVIAAAFPMNDERLREFGGIARADTAILANLAPRGTAAAVKILASTATLGGEDVLERIPSARATFDALFARGEGAGPFEFASGDDVFIGSLLPIQSGSGETIAGLLVARSKQAEMGSFRAIRRSLVLVGAGLLLGALPFSFLLARRLALPIRQLAGAASRVAGGDLDVVLPRSTGGEVGALSTAFRTMVNELKEKAQLEALIGQMHKRPSEITVSDMRPGPSTGESDGLEPGKIFAGRYEVRSLLGEGGMGKVFRVRDRELDEEVALKALKPEFLGTAGTVGVEALRQEIKLARLVTHPNVVRVHDFGEAAGIRYYTMEYVPGTPLNDLLARSTGLDLPPALQIAKQMCRGLSAVHKAGVIHGDLKPQNIMVGGAGVVKLMDFGVARSRGRVDEGSPVAGTPLYMSPEQARGAPVDDRSDLYSAGAVIYEMFTGEPPFRSTSVLTLLSMHIHEPPPDPRRIRRDMPDRLAEAILSCLDKSPLKRPSDAAELERQLLRARR